MLKIIVACFLILSLAALAWLLIGMWLKNKWPARIPVDLAFVHDFSSQLTLRAIAERLAEQFRELKHENVVCLGPVRGTAARLLFHAGPKNSGRNKNIHRDDYILHVERLGKSSVRLRLDTNKPYPNLIIKRKEVEVLSSALEKTFGELRNL